MGRPASIVQPWTVQGGATLFSKGEAQRFARQLLHSQAYRDSLEGRIKTGTLSAPIEQMLWAYAYGKPVEQVNLTVSQGAEDLSLLSVEELHARAKALSDQLEEAQTLNDALPAEFKVA